MNRHFNDARYYLKRTAETAAKGVAKELEPVRKRARRLAGREEEPDPSRFESARAVLRNRKMKAEREARETLAEVREKFAT